MRLNRHFLRGPMGLPALFIFLLFGLGSCKVYTINKTEFESRLKPRAGEVKGLTLNSIYRQQFRNDIDTISFLNSVGKVQYKRVNYDSKITVITNDQKVIRFYVKSLYIYKDQFLIGERTAPKLRGPNYFPVRLSDISRIEFNSF